MSDRETPSQIENKKNPVEVIISRILSSISIILSIAALVISLFQYQLAVGNADIGFRTGLFSSQIEASSNLMEAFVETISTVSKMAGNLQYQSSEFRKVMATMASGQILKADDYGYWKFSMDAAGAKQTELENKYLDSPQIIRKWVVRASIVFPNEITKSAEFDVSDEWMTEISDITKFYIDLIKRVNVILITKNTVAAGEIARTFQEIDNKLKHEADLLTKAQADAEGLSRMFNKYFQTRRTVGSLLEK